MGVSDNAFFLLLLIIFFLIALVHTVIGRDGARTNQSSIQESWKRATRFLDYAIFGLVLTIVLVIALIIIYFFKGNSLGLAGHSSCLGLYFFALLFASAAGVYIVSGHRDLTRTGFWVFNDPADKELSEDLTIAAVLTWVGIGILVFMLIFHFIYGNVDNYHIVETLPERVVGVVSAGPEPSARPCQIPTPKGCGPPVPQLATMCPQRPEISC